MQIYHDGPGEAAVTCQILPADFPGHQPYCPYTAGPKDGFWHGPDLAKARRLAQESGTTNVPVTVWEYAGKQGKAVGAYLVQLFRQLGYQATLHTPPPGLLYAAVSNSHRKVQMGPYVWGADSPTASDFFGPALTCQSFYEDPANALNVAEYCSPQGRQAGQPGARPTVDRSRRGPEAMGAGRPHRHQPGTLGPPGKRRTNRVRLLPGRELPGLRGIWASARPGLGPVVRLHRRV
jgi:hypothetical protein